MTLPTEVKLLLASQGGYQISRSVRLRSSASAYFNRTFGSGGNTNTWTWSAWVKRGALGGGNLFNTASPVGSNTLLAQFAFSNDTLDFLQFTGGVTYTRLITTQVFRDPSAWYHIVLRYDDTQATAANRVRLYVNGVQITVFSTASYPTQNFSGFTNSAQQHIIGYYAGSGGGGFFDGYITEVNFIGGQSLDPSSFGETNAVTGVWQPKKYTGTYGTNGFYLNFSDNSNNTATTIGKDYSGNSNNWTPNNISVTAGVTYDSMLDVPTQWADGGNGRGNYATCNPLKSTASLSSANLQAVNAGSSGYYTAYATMAMDSGKYYWEITGIDDGVNARFAAFGIADPSVALTSIATSTVTGTQAANARGWAQTVRSAISAYSTGLYNNGSTINTTNRSTTTGTRIFMIAYDADTGKCWMGYEGTWWSGDPAAGTSQYFTATAPMVPVINPYNDGSNSALAYLINFGQRPFAYTPPTGFKALNTLNLPAPTILKGNQYFDATTYTGNGGTLSVTNSGGMQPDLVWVKARSLAYSNYVYDAVRGTGTGASLITDATAAEGAGSANANLTAFNSNGFSLGTTSGINGMNANAGTFVGWQWKEGATQGFDIVTYTGTGANRTVSHSLGVAPSMMIMKRRDNVGAWFVYHAAQGATKYMTIDTAAATTSSTAWNNTAPTSSVFTVGTDNNVNGTSGTYVAYLFAAVAGFSAFGSYTGNGSADGAFLFCGFRPRFVMVKQTNAVGNWLIWDTARSNNQMQDYLSPNSSSAELNNVLVSIDALSNGFKCRTADNDINGSGDTYIFAAFAEHPFKHSLAR